jgi:thiamine biosynthesis lipoprotein
MKESINHPVIFDHTKEFQALGTKNQIMIYGSHSEGLLQRAINRVMEIDDKMSAFKPDSEISNINQNAGNNEVSISMETLELFDRAKKMSELSKGAFDITIGPLVRLWGIGKRGSFIPAGNEIKECLRMVHYQDLFTDREHKTAYLQNAGQSVDLGGIAKGYAADEVKKILVQGGVSCAVINLGGNIMTIGTKPDGSPWRIGIQNPLAPTGEYLGSVSVTDRTIVTSGSNERFFMKDGIRYHHLLDPRTGRPAKSGLLSVTVISEKSAEADALTTALFLLGIEEGLSLLKAFQAEAIFLIEDGRIFVTEGLRNNYQNKMN